MLEAQAEGEAGARRKRHASLQEQLQGLWVRVKLFEKGADLFDGTTTFLPSSISCYFSPAISFDLSLDHWIGLVAC